MARLPLCSIVVASCLVVSAQAQAANTQITGQLKKRGYTLILLSKDAKAKTFRAPGKFELKAPGKTATLHLRAPNGKYAGPVVVGEISKKEVIVGVTGGAALGKIEIKDGYAVAGREVKDEYLVKGRTAKAKKGKPIGAGNYGRVKTKGGAATGGGEDPDRDGVPNVFDADDDGDLNLDNTDAAPSGALTRTGFRTYSWLLLGMGDVGAAAMNLVMERLPGEPVELDCAKLRYCSKGGTGQVDIPSPPNAGIHDFPADYDGDGDGFGSMNRASEEGVRGPEFHLYPRATSPQIGPGDTFIQRVGATELPGSLGFVFTTTPQLLEWSDTAGDSGKITYPADPATGPGTQGNRLLLGAGTDDKVVLTVTLARPQRPGFPNERGSAHEVGHLSYHVLAGAYGSCNVSTLSTVDSDLQVPSSGGPGGLLDTLGDAAPAEDRSLTFQVDITECLNGNNEAGATDPWAPGDQMDLGLRATSPAGDIASQSIFVQHK